jgi:hypothetical protein
MKKILMYLGIISLVLGLGGMAGASTTFTFDAPALALGALNGDIGTYMTGVYGSAVTVSGAAHVSKADLLGNATTDQYVESDVPQNGTHLIQINFAHAITGTVSYDWGTFTDSFNAEYLDGNGIWHTFQTVASGSGALTGTNSYNFG